MAQALEVKQQVYQPKRQGFASEADRSRLAATAIKAYRRLAGQWDLTAAQAAALLGVSVSTWERLKSEGQARSPVKALSQDQMTRISVLTGIYKGLHLLFADAMADRWPRLPNSGPLFEERSPITAMMDGGIPVMLDVRRYVDAVRGGM